MQGDPKMDIPAQAALWAIHRHALISLATRQQLATVVPGSILQLAGAFGASARAPVHPGATRHGTVLVLPIVGILAPAGMMTGGTSYDAIESEVRNAAADRSVTAIVLDVRSPGGTVWGCAEAADAIYETRAIKPIVAVASPYSFSAAHWLATQAGSYFATKSGEVGSVGVRSGHVDMSGFQGKIGIRTTLIASSPQKIAAHPYAPLSDEDRAEIQAGVDEQSRAFVRAIARGRNLRAEDVHSVHGSGATFSARRAKIAGAIDGIASLREAVSGCTASRSRSTLMRRQAEAMEQSLQL